MKLKECLMVLGKKHLLKSALGTASQIFMEHKGTILTGSTIAFNAGGIAVTYRNSPKIHEAIAQYKRDLSCIDPSLELYEQYKSEYLKKCLMTIGPLIAPIIFFFAASTASAIVNQKQNEAKIATLTAALSLAQSTISEYDSFKEEARKELGDEKFKEIEEAVMQKRAEEIPVENYTGVKVGIGEVLCCIPDFNIFFSSTREKIEFAMDRVNGVLAANGRDGRSYGHGSKYGNEVVTYADILYELNDPQIEIPKLAHEISWSAGSDSFSPTYIRFDTYEGGVTRSGIPYMILNIDLSGSNVGK